MFCCASCVKLVILRKTVYCLKKETLKIVVNCFVTKMSCDDQAPEFISAQNVQRLLKYKDLIPVIENSLTNFSDHENGGVVQPVRTTIEVKGNNGLLYTMPCFSKKDEALAAKMVTRFPDQHPSHHSTLLLFNSKTGAIQSIMDGEVITSMRTAAASAVALKYLASKNCKILCILGSGKQAYSHVDAFKHVHNFTEVRVWSRTFANAQQFAKDTGAVPYDTVKEAVKQADVIVTVTSAKTPVLFGNWVKPGAFVCAVGAPYSTARELDDELMHQSTIIVDSCEGALVESGDIILSKANITGELGEVISGKVTVKPAKNIIFKSLGMAVYDAVSTKLVYDKYHSK